MFVISLLAPDKSDFCRLLSGTKHRGNCSLKSGVIFHKNDYSLTHDNNGEYVFECLDFNTGSISPTVEFHIHSTRAMNKFIQGYLVNIDLAVSINCDGDIRVGCCKCGLLFHVRAIETMNNKACIFHPRRGLKNCFTSEQSPLLQAPPSAP